MKGVWTAEDVGKNVFMEYGEGRWPAPCRECGDKASVVYSWGVPGKFAGGVAAELAFYCRDCAEEVGIIPPCRNYNSGSYDEDNVVTC